MLGRCRIIHSQQYTTTDNYTHKPHKNGSQVTLSMLLLHCSVLRRRCRALLYCENVHKVAAGHGPQFYAVAQYQVPPPHILLHTKMLCSLRCVRIVFICIYMIHIFVALWCVFRSACLTTQHRCSFMLVTYCKRSEASCSTTESRHEAYCSCKMYAVSEESKKKTEQNYWKRRLASKSACKCDGAIFIGHAENARSKACDVQSLKAKLPR